MNGVILLKKPKGMTSFDAVRKCRWILKEKKAGHSGTLDPNAEGLMILFFGKYTKLVPFCMSNHKHYIAEFVMGKRTETQDIWGDVVEEKETKKHTQEELNEAAARLTGDIMQVPPMYSALKKDGKKLYEYARAGIEVEREARPCTINSLTVTEGEDGVFHMDAVVSSGTYIRTLIEDYCKELGEIGTMTALVRAGIEDLSLDDAVTFEELEEGKGLVDPMRVIDPEWVRVETDQVADIMNGKTVRIDTKEAKILLVHEGQLLAAYERLPNGYYHCVRGLF